MKRYPWKWSAGLRWPWWLAIYKGTLRAFVDDSEWGRTWVSMPRVPPDTARRALTCCPHCFGSRWARKTRKTPEE